MRIYRHFDKITLRFVLYVLFFTFFFGCAGKEVEKREPFFEKWRVVAKESKGYSPPKKRRSIELPVEIKEVTPEQKAKAEKPLPTKKITLRMHKIDITILFRALARAVDLNIIINESVKGKISINAKKAPWDEVFRSILRTQGLSYDWEGNIIRIVTLEDKKKNLDQLEAEQKLKSIKKEMQMVEPLLTKVIKIDYADAKKLKVNLEKFLTEKAEGKALGSIMVDEHSNSVIIQAIRSDIVKIINLIEELDMPTPQILIEAHIVETTSETARELGIEWGGLNYLGSNNWITSGASSTGVIGQPISSGAIDPTSGYAVNFPIIGTGMNIGYVAQNVGKNILAIQLSALQTEGRLNILSSPSITTLDNQSAIFESGMEVPYSTETEPGVYKTEFKKAVLKLEVKPNVIDGKTIKMEIKTNKDEVDPTSVGDIPRIITKKAETNVILFNGQTMVIGGLSKETTADSKSSVPGLGDIPLLGWLFRGKKSEKTMEEVLIFITPHILGQWIAEEPIPEEPKPEPKPAKEKITEKVIPHEKKFFSVQVGAFLIKWDAHKMMASLRWRGYTPYVFQGMDYTRNRKFFAVRIGDYENMEKAYEAFMLYKKKEGMPAVVTYIDSISAVPETETQ